MINPGLLAQVKEQQLKTLRQSDLLKKELEELKEQQQCIELKKQLVEQRKVLDELMRSSSPVEEPITLPIRSQSAPPRQSPMVVLPTVNWADVAEAAETEAVIVPENTQLRLADKPQQQTIAEMKAEQMPGFGQVSRGGAGGPDIPPIMSFDDFKKMSKPWMQVQKGKKNPKWFNDHGDEFMEEVYHKACTETRNFQIEEYCTYGDRCMFDNCWREHIIKPQPFLDEEMFLNSSAVYEWNCHNVEKKRVWYENFATLFRKAVWAESCNNHDQNIWSYCTYRGKCTNENCWRYHI